jgi:iron complex transport system ATP-binding protein
MTLVCKDVTLTVAGRTLCEALNFTVRPGEVWGVLGPNGSGKTTLLNVLAGLATPARGEVTLDDQPLSSVSATARARAIGILPQHEDSEFWGTVLDYAGLGSFPARSAWLQWQSANEAQAHTALARVGMADFSARRYATLSGGERQRVRLAQLLVQAPRYLLMDEPLQHLDLRYQRQTLELLAELAREPRGGRSIVLVLHDVLWPARVCTHALLLDGAGGVRAGTAQAVLSRANLESLFGCALQPVGEKPEAGFVPAI